MTFLNPLVLLGLAAAAIPIVVHLFNFRRPRRVDFSTLRFLREVERQSMRRVRIRQWLLLALRTLAIVCLVLAFARPSQTGALAGVFADGAARSVALVVETSLSASLRSADGEILEQAQALAEGLIRASERGDERVVVPTAPEPGALPTRFVTPEPGLDAVAALRPQPGADVLTGAVARAASLLEGALHPRREIVVVSDLQRSMLTDSAAVGLPDDVDLTLVPVGGRRPANTAVTAVRVLSRIVEPGRPVEIEATVARWGGSAGAVGATLSLDGRPVGEAAVDVAPGRPGTVRFTVTPPARGWLAGEVRIEPDAAEWDDARYFALRVPPPPRVLLVTGEGPADRLRLALGVAAEAGALRVSERDESALGGADLDRLDAVVLSAPRDLSPGEAQALAAFVRRGGGVFLFAGEGVAEGGASALLGALGAGSFGGVSEGAPAARTTDADTDHPLFAGVFDASRPRLEAVEARRIARYRPAGGATLIGTTAGTPLLHEVRAGDGALLVATVPPDPAWSDLSQRGLWVPLLLRAAGYLAAGTDAAANETLSVRGGGTVRVEGADAGAPLRLVRIGAAQGGAAQGGAAQGGAASDSSASALTPSQRAVPGAVLLDVDEAAVAPGVYRVMQGGREVRKVAVNGDPRESDPTLATPEEAAEALQAATGRPVRVLDGPAALASLRGEDATRAGVPVWTWLLGVALLCLVAETALTTRLRPDAAA